MSLEDDASPLEIANGVHRWLNSQVVETDAGISWQSHSRFPDPQIGIYYGTSGVALFYLELYERTRSMEFLKIASRAGDEIAARLPEKLNPVRRHNASYKDMEVNAEPSLYFGVSGAGFVLTEIHKRTKSETHEAGALKCIQLIADAALQQGDAVSWNEVRDVTTGTAGIGLGLSYLAKSYNNATARDLAIAAGRGLIAQGIREDTGLRWEWELNELRHHGNFAHGTAGTAYFLLELYRSTGDESFLDAARAGARYLAGVTAANGLICLSFNEYPNIYYLGWCHGPVGTGRFYYLLWKVTGDERWLEPLFKAADSMRRIGVFDAASPGPWNNVGICCGLAGLVEFFLHLYVVANELGRGDPEIHLATARDVAARIRERATPGEAGGLKWIQSEHRIMPDLLVAQTGYMQGAAGIGTAFLYLDALSSTPRDTNARTAARSHITLPDSPFLRIVGDCDRQG